MIMLMDGIVTAVPMLVALVQCMEVIDIERWVGGWTNSLLEMFREIVQVISNLCFAGFNGE